MQNWYNKINGNFDLPVRIQNDNDYLQELKNKYKEYKELLEKSSVPEKKIEKVDNICSNIVKAVRLYYNGKILSAQNAISEILKEYKNNEFIISDMDSNYAFRGMIPFYKDKRFEEIRNTELNFFKARVVYGDEILERKDMLHIPFDKREIIKTQRFSIPGIPCMYLGTSSYVCWLELGKPKNTEFNVSSYKINKKSNNEKLKVLNLTLCWSLLCGASSGVDYGLECTLDDDTIIESCLYLMPLIIATSFVVENKERVFKSEYIISHLVMLCLNDIGIDAVAYISKRVKYDYIGYPNAVNIAIPMKQNKDEQFSNQCNQIALTTPINFEEFCKLHHGDRHTFNKSYINIDSIINNNILFAGQYLRYNSTIFSEFDNYLVSQDHKIVKGI